MSLANLSTLRNTSFLLKRAAPFTTAFAQTLTPVATNEVPKQSIDDLFGTNTFNTANQAGRVPEETQESIKNSIKNMTPVSSEDADVYAKALADWALENGATHFTHWFQPLTGNFAWKHDSFLKKKGDGAISEFKGKQLLRGEPDGSSFPSGGLRQTHQARGYTLWDPNSTPFLADHGNGKTLVIPSVFYSWTGHALDEKLPLLRSNRAVKESILRLLKAAGSEGHETAHVECGIEQEFFLVDREHYLKRPDLVEIGRTVLGRAPSKGQSLDDQYFADISDRMLSVINDAERELWKLGIPMICRHREVAPGQYEVAPMFQEGTQASDNNTLLMSVLQKAARRHDVAAVFHEKPFRGLNGTGKHNNWSVGTNKTPTLFEPGASPETNLEFMLTLGATLRAVDLHGDVMRISISGAGNDHRLGAQEAPPAIMSAYLGEDIEEAVAIFTGAKATKAPFQAAQDLGAGYLPQVDRATTDRNRTSSFAFTGNKFEFRAVGGSQPVGRSTTALNTILAESMDVMSAEIEGLVAGGMDRSAAAKQVAVATLKNHTRGVFGGDGYSAEWHEEAARRGLPNLRTTPMALAEFTSAKNVELFSKMGVLTEQEVHARQETFEEEYSTKISMEADMLAQLAQTKVLPAAVEYQTLLAGSLQMNASAAQSGYLGEVTRSTDGLIEALAQLRDARAAASSAADFCDNVIPAMDAVREHADTLENVLPAKAWPLPSYHEMLFHQD